MIEPLVYVFGTFGYVLLVFGLLRALANLWHWSHPKRRDVYAKLKAKRARDEFLLAMTETHKW